MIPNHNSNERIILIHGDSSKWYDQAIFIVKRNLPKQNMPLDFVEEAENIISSYMLKTGPYANKQNLVAKYSANSSVPLSAVPAVPTVPTKKKPSPKKRKGFDIALNICLILCCIALAVLIYQITK